MPKSPDSLLAIFSNDRHSEDDLEELGADDILEEEAPAPVADAAPVSTSDAEATLPPVDRKLAQPIPEPVIKEAPAPVEAASDPEMQEATIVLERKAMDEAAAAEKRSEPAADRTMRMERTDALSASRILASVPPAPTTSPVLPSAAPTHRTRHPSIAPVAFDVARSAPPPAAPVSSGPSGAMIALVAAGFVLLAGSITTGVLLGRRPAVSVASASTTTTTTTKAAEPKEPSVEGAGTAEINANPPTAAAKDATHASEPSELPSADVASLPSAPPPTAAKPAQHHTVAAKDPAPAKEAAPAPKAEAKAPVADAKPAAQPASQPAAAAPRSGNAPSSGVIRVPQSDSIITIKVDGSHRRVKNGAVVIGCGHHTVQVGTSVMKEVDVPCGGAVFVE